MKDAMLSKMPGDDWQKLANLRSLYAYMFAHPGKKLNFMGGEIGQWDEWNHDASLDWHLVEHERHRQLQLFVQDLNKLYRTQPALFQIDFSWTGFEWIDFRDVDNSIISFIRKGHEGVPPVITVANFTPMIRSGYRLGMPRPGFYRELLNTDASQYGGSGVGNQGGITADDIPWQGQPFSALLTLPPLAVLYLQPQESVHRNSV